jgi:hypothetical protein
VPVDISKRVCMIQSRRVAGGQVEPRVMLPENRAFAGTLIDQDVSGLAGAAGDFDEMSFNFFTGELIAVQASCPVISDLADVARAQAPAMAGDRSAGGLSARQNPRRADLDLGIELGEERQPDDRVAAFRPSRRKSWQALVWRMWNFKGRAEICKGVWRRL